MGGDRVTKKPKTTHICTVECPHCSGIIEVFKHTEIITPAQKADKKESFFTRKGKQTTLRISQT